MTTQLAFQLRACPTFHDSRGGAALLIFLTAQPEYPSHATVTADGIVHVHLQTLRRGARLNRMLRGFLARHLAVPLEHIEIAAGADGAGKIVCFYHITPVELEHRLLRWLQGVAPRVW